MTSKLLMKFMDRRDGKTKLAPAIKEWESSRQYLDIVKGPYVSDPKGGQLYSLAKTDIQRCIDIIEAQRPCGQCLPEHRSSLSSMGCETAAGRAYFDGLS